MGLVVMQNSSRFIGSLGHENLLDKNIEKFEAHEKKTVLYSVSRWVSFGINSTAPIKSIAASKL